MNRPQLRVLVVAAADSQALFAARVLEDHGDRPDAARDVPDALNRLAREHFDVALISLSLPRGDGLALVHHLRALHPDVDVLVLALPSEIQETAHAMALGVLSVVMLPLTGDGLMVALDRARERRVLIQERQRLANERAHSQRRSATYARCAAFVAETDASAVAARILDACAAELEAAGGVVYAGDGYGGTELRRAASLGGAEETLPDTLNTADLGDLDPTRVVHTVEGGGVRVVVMGDMDVGAVVRLVESQPLDDDRREGLALVSALGAAALSAARKVDAVSRTGIKDPDTSAYTFAYFGDVAGREIDRAARHSRRFTLMTLSIDGLAQGAGRSGSELVELRKTVVDALLDAVRDSDVLARVEDEEFYLLLPETGLLGALACRRRIARRLTAIKTLSADWLDPVVGISVYPSDGADLGRLLRASRRRAERSRHGVWRKLGLSNVPFWDAVERVLGGEDDTGLARDGRISLHRDLRQAHDDAALARHAAVSEALVPEIAGAIAADAIRHSLAGTMYVAGDPALAGSVGRAVELANGSALRAWSLGNRAPPTEAARRIHLQVDDPRLGDRVLLLALTELGGYTFVARRVRPGTLLAYHASDLDLVDGLVTALQHTYHLQPEVR